METNFLELLRAADDADSLEAPPGFDWRKSSNAVYALKRELESVLGHEMEFDDRIQDASFFADLALLKQTTNRDITEAVIVFRFSCFGKLFTAWSSCSQEKKLPEALIKKAGETLERAGYTCIDAQILEQKYTGVHPYFQEMTWRSRFFDYN